MHDRLERLLYAFNVSLVFIRSLTRSLSLFFCWFRFAREICNFLLIRFFLFGYYRFEKTLLLLLLCWLPVREMLCKFIQPPFSTLKLKHFIFVGRFVLTAHSLFVLYIFLINMHNNVGSGQFKCTQRFLWRCNWESKWEINCEERKKNKNTNYWLSKFTNITNQIKTDEKTNSIPKWSKVNIDSIWNLFLEFWSSKMGIRQF